MWQEIIVGVIVLIAFVALARRLWLLARRGSSCGSGCGSCSAPKNASATPAKPSQTAAPE